jgi:hypothetical protein
MYINFLAYHSAKWKCIGESQNPLIYIFFVFVTVAYRSQAFGMKIWLTSVEGLAFETQQAVQKRTSKLVAQHEP